MKLKNLINYLLENVDEAAIRGFSLDILKKKMPEFKKYQYAENIGTAIKQLIEQYDLPYMGRGSSRVVYALSTGKVLKIAKNGKGVAQNEAEHIVSQSPSLKYIGARVYDTDPDYHWSVMEVAKIYNDSTQLKLDLGIPPELAERYGYHITSAIDNLRAVYNRGIDIEEIIVDRYGESGLGGYRDPLDREDVEAYRKFLEDPPKGLLALVDLTEGELGDHALEYGDIVTDHFGRTADGRPVLIDYGFTTGVMEDYYRSNSYNSYGSPPPSSIMSQDEEEDMIEIPRVSDQERINRYMERGRRGGGGSGEQV